MSYDSENSGQPGGKRITRTLDERLIGDSSTSYLPVLDTALFDESASILKRYLDNTFPDGSKPIQLGSGVVRGLIGQGGMARVYRVWNEKMEVHRAVKVYYLSGREELRKRFETEIKISAKLSHPNIVQIHSTGEWNGYPYIEMELVEGVTLEKLISQCGKITFETVTSIGIQIADALCYAHKMDIVLYGKTYRGIIHRDLKPANIMVSESGTVKLLDFGIARPAEVGLHTVSGNIVGTLPYLSPEQIDNMEIDQRSDLYSLGTILYEALTGEKTFPQESITALMKMKSIGQYREFETFSCNIPISLSKIVKKCLNENKDDRFRSSLELKNELMGFLRSNQDQSPSLIVQNYLCNREYEKLITDKNKSAIKRIFFISGLLTVIGIVIFFYFQFLGGKESKVRGFQFIGDSSAVSVSDATDSVGKKPQVKEMNIGKRDANNNRTGAGRRKATVSNVRPPIQNPIVQLKAKYRKSNLYEIGDSACKAMRFNEAITALKSISPGDNDYNNGLILLAYAYLESDSLEKSRKVAESINSLDAFFCIIMGRIEYASRNEMKALEIFQLALTRASEIRSDQYARSESLYYAALVYDNWFRANPSPENRQFALISWKKLQRMYKPGQQRYHLAIQKISSYEE